MTVSEYRLTKSLPYILFEKYVCILSLETCPAPGTSTVPIVSAHLRSLPTVLAGLLRHKLVVCCVSLW